MQAGAPSPSQAAPASPADAWATVLLVEDDRSALLVMQEQVTGLGYNVLTATNGAEAFALLRETPGCADVVMTDRMMPVLDGLGLTRRLKRERATKHIPVVVLTGAKDPADVSSGIEAGAFYYLTKPSTGELIASVLGAAMQEVARHKKVREDLDSHQTAFRNMEVVRFRLRRPDEVDSVVSMLASMHDAPDRIIQGIYELVQNAVEHGVLRFGLEDKGRLLDEGRWEAALAERVADPAYAEGWAEATAIRREDGIYINIKDNGPGFNWRPYLKTDPSRAGALCGRGIARAANFAFDKLHYDETGNQAVAFIARSPRVKW